MVVTPKYQAYNVLSNIGIRICTYRLKRFKTIKLHTSGKILRLVINYFQTALEILPPIRDPSCCRFSFFIVSKRFSPKFLGN